MLIVELNYNITREMLTTIFRARIPFCSGLTLKPSDNVR